MLHGVEVRRVHGTAVFALQPRGKLSLWDSCLLARFSQYLAEGLHSNSSAPATAARRLLILKQYSGGVKRYNITILQIHKQEANISHGRLNFLEEVGRFDSRDAIVCESPLIPPEMRI